jgi:probable HAF family extracellular repeat protein
MSMSIKSLGAAAACLAAVGAHANRYTIVDLGINEEPAAVNRVDAVVSFLDEEHHWRGQIYRNGRWHNLEARSAPDAINRAGHVVGVDGRNFPTFWPHNGDPVKIQLPNFGAMGSAAGVNNGNVVVGYYIDANSSPQCYLWTIDDGAVDIGSGRFKECAARAINGLDQVTGQSISNAGNQQHAFFWSQGQFIDLGVLPGTLHSEGISINDSGEVVGASYASQGARAFYWNGTLVDLDPDRKFYSSVATSINDSGSIVGWTRKSNGNDTVAVRFSRGKTVYLLSEVSNPENWELRTATSINNKGVIVGVGHRPDTDNQDHGYMLIPE